MRGLLGSGAVLAAAVAALGCQSSASRLNGQTIASHGDMAAAVAQSDSMSAEMARMREASARCRPSDARTPLDVELSAGAALLYPLAEKASGEPSGADVSAPTRQANLIGKFLVDYSSRPFIEWSFLVLDSQRPVAFAAPGGFVVVTTGLLATLTDESQLAYVLAHELSHVTGRHQLADLEQRRELTCRVQFASQLMLDSTRSMQAAANDGGVFAKPNDLDAVVKQLVDSMPSPRAAGDEFDADRQAAVLLLFAGFNLDEAWRFATDQPAFCLLAIPGKGQPAPTGASRVAAMREIVGEYPGFWLDSRQRPMPR